MTKDNVRSLIDYRLCSTLSKINYISRQIVKDYTYANDVAPAFQSDFLLSLIDFD